jgi:hypothetical protein
MDEQPVETYRSTLVVMTKLNAATVYDFRVAAGVSRCHEKLPPVDGRQQCFAISRKLPCAWALVDVLTSTPGCHVVCSQHQGPGRVVCAIPEGEDPSRTDAPCSAQTHRAPGKSTQRFQPMTRRG